MRERNILNIILLCLIGSVNLLSQSSGSVALKEIPVLIRYCHEDECKNKDSLSELSFESGNFITLRFANYFDDSIQLYINQHLYLNEYIKTDSVLGIVENKNVSKSLTIGPSDDCNLLRMSLCLINSKLKVNGYFDCRYNFADLFFVKNQLVIYHTNRIRESY